VRSCALLRLEQKNFVTSYDEVCMRPLAKVPFPRLSCLENIVYYDEDTKHIKSRKRFRNRDEEIKTKIEIVVLLVHLVTCKNVHKLRVTCYHMYLKRVFRRRVYSECLRTYTQTAMCSACCIFASHNYIYLLSGAYAGCVSFRRVSRLKIVISAG